MLATLTLGARIDDVAEGRTLHLDALEVTASAMHVEYRLVPGRGPGDRDDLALAWDVEAEDDVGTEYDSSSGGFGDDDPAAIRGHRSITPAPPPLARRLVLVVSAYQRDGGWRERARVEVALPPAG